MVDHKNVVISKRLVIINSASSVLAKIANVTVLLWMYQYLLSRISAEEFAVLPVVMSLMVFAPLFFSFFTGGISRFVVEAYAKGDFARVTSIISSIFPLLVLIGVVFLVCGTIFALNIEKILNVPAEMVVPARVMMCLLVASFTLQMLALPFLSGFHVRQRFVELNLFGIGRDFLRILLLLIFLLGIGPQVVWVVVATTISEAAHSVFAIWRSRFLVPELRLQRDSFHWRQALELTSFGLWTTLGRLGSVMYTNAATILLNLYGTAIDVTNYHLGATLYRQIDSTVGLAAQPLQPVLIAMHALDDQSRLAETVMRGGRYALWITLAVATPLMIYSDTFIQLYLGDTYSQASVVIILFMIIFPFTSPTALMAMTAIATGEVRAFFLPAFIFQLIGLILMVVVINSTELGAMAVTLSLTAITILSQVSYFWGLCLKLTRRTFSQFVQKVLVPGCTPAIASSIVWIASDMTILPVSWNDLIICTLAGILVYLGVLSVLFFNRSE